MKGTNNTYIYKIGQVFGFMMGYLILTIVWYFAFSFFGKLPENWTFWNLAFITASITMFGLVLRRIFK